MTQKGATDRGGGGGAGDSVGAACNACGATAWARSLHPATINAQARQAASACLFESPVATPLSSPCTLARPQVRIGETDANGKSNVRHGSKAGSLPGDRPKCHGVRYRPEADIVGDAPLKLRCLQARGRDCPTHRRSRTSHHRFDSRTGLSPRRPGLLPRSTHWAWWRPRSRIQRDFLRRTLLNRPLPSLPPPSPTGRSVPAKLSRRSSLGFRNKPPGA